MDEKKAIESIERIGLTTIETQSGGCRVKRGWSRRRMEGCKRREGQTG